MRFLVDRAGRIRCVEACLFGLFTVKVPPPTGGINSGMPSAPARLSSCGGASVAGRMQVLLGNREHIVKKKGSQIYTICEPFLVFKIAVFF